MWSTEIDLKKPICVVWNSESNFERVYGMNYEPKGDEPMFIHRSSSFIAIDPREGCGSWAAWTAVIAS